jgi:hypothetical protein
MRVRFVMLLNRSFAIATAIALAPSLCIANEKSSPSSEPITSQKWQMEEQTADLRAQFPMCDDFLKISWLDQDKEVGYATFQTLIDGVPYGERKASLVYIDLVYPRYDLDISDWWKTKKLAELTRIIKAGGIILQPDTATDVDFSIPGESVGAPLNGYIGITLNQHQSNVCIPLPSGKYQGNNRYLDYDRLHFRKYFESAERAKSPSDSAHLWMWVAELKTPDGAAFPDDKVRQMYGGLLMPNADGSQANSGAVTLRLDGVRRCGILEVRPNEFACVDTQAIFYNHAGRYFKTEWLFELKQDIGTDKYGKIAFPPENRACQIYDPLKPYLITNGEQIFLNNTCNLTEVAR